jgi:hypothetical protein
MKKQKSKVGRDAFRIEFKTNLNELKRKIVGIEKLVDEINEFKITIKTKVSKII